jgi:hypothetical protein
MNRSLSLVLLIALGACARGPKHTVADTELSVLGGKGLDAVDAARQEEAAAQQALVARRAEDLAAQREIRIADYAIRRDEADLEVARLRFEAIQETHDADAMLPANGRRAKAEHAVATSKAELAYRQAARAHASARVDEAEAAVALALARIERAKLDAVLGGQQNLLPQQVERKAAFDVQLAKAQAALAEQSAEVVQAANAMQAAESDWKAVAARP